MKLFVVLACTSALLPGQPAAAQSAGHTGTPGEDPYHDEATDIVVTAPFARSRGDLLSGVTVLSGAALNRDVKPTIGDTLAHQPGVSATSFGPNASRPVLRGFQGERVRVLTDGIGSFDVSNTSVDHAVVINPLTADRIEVLRGPSALLYGSSAIGGVVNVIDRRIPRKIPDEHFHIEGNATYGSAADERSGGASVDVPAGRIVLHLDGSWAKSGDLDTGGAILAPALRARAAASPDADIAALADLKGRLPNSAGRTWDVAGGAALITDTGNLGFSVSRYDSLYDVPVRLSLDPAVDAERVSLDVKQIRADFRSETDLGDGFFERLRTRWGWADYKHAEIDDQGTVGTRFFSQGIEGRIELAQAKRGVWKGAIGGQLVVRDIDIVGDEKFLPRSETQQYGLFTVQEFNFGALKAELGGRYEYSRPFANADAILGNPDLKRDFNALSGSAGASFAVADGWRLGLNLSHTERAPSAEELFANGPHAGTQAFEIGDPDLAKEKSDSVEATIRGSGDGYSFEASAYHSWFAGYIYEAQTGAIVDDLPVFRQAQADARYYGFEVQGSLRLARIGDWSIVTDGLADYVRATITSAGPAPRIPPLRLLAGIEAQSDVAQGRIEVERVTKQDRVAAFETDTAGYTMVNASLSVKPFGAGSHSSIVLSANNLFDVTARRHASFLKDYAPLAGRDIRISARLSL